MVCCIIAWDARHAGKICRTPLTQSRDLRVPSFSLVPDELHKTLTLVRIWCENKKCGM